MDMYDQILEELRSLVGPGKRFKSDADLASHCDMDPAFVHKHLRGKIKGDKIKPIFNLLQKVGAQIVMPGGPAEDKVEVASREMPLDMAALKEENLQLRAKLDAAQDRLDIAQGEYYEIVGKLTEATDEAFDAYRELARLAKAKRDKRPKDEKTLREMLENPAAYPIHGYKYLNEERASYSKDKVK